MVFIDIEKYIQAFSHIHTDINHVRWTSVTYWRAPHKLFLLLSVLDQISKKVLQTNFIEITPELEKIYAGYWKCFMPDYQSDITLPFFHLKGDSFWHLIPQSGKESILKYTKEIRTISQLNKLIKGAKLDDELFYFLQEEESRSKLRKVIVQSYFISDIQHLFLDQSTPNSQYITSKANKHLGVSVPSSTLLDNLYIDDNSNWKKIPQWIRFFFDLGVSITTYKDLNQPFTLALAIPTRAYASLLIASGINYGRVFIPQEKIDQEYVDFLLSLEQNTPVFYREGNIKYNALIDHCHPEFYQGKKIIGLRTSKGKLIGVDISKARHISLDDKDTIRLPENQKGRKLVSPNSFINAIFGENANEFTLASHLETIIIGSLNILREESSLGFSLISKGSNNCPGQLEDLIRAFSKYPKGVAYRSFLWSKNAKLKPTLPEGIAPFAIIFDGAQAYSNWKDYFANPNRIIILDKTERNFRYMVEHINNEYYSNRSEKQIKLNIPTIPSGIEVMVFGVNN